MNHVICRLYKIENYQYPPQIDNTTLDAAIKPSYLAYQIKGMNEDIDPAEIPKMETQRNLLNSLTFYISRETPFEILTLLIHSYGGHIVYSIDDKSITHIITDRIIEASQYTNTEVVQTQWVVDSCNFEILLPTAEYAPGADLPPHISPFKTYIKEAEYLPDRMKEILKLKGIQAQEMDDKSYIDSYMELEDTTDDVVEANDFSNLRYEVRRDKEREKKYITTGAETEQKGLQRLTLTKSKKKKHIQLFKEKRDKMKKFAQVKQRRVMMQEESGTVAKWKNIGNQKLNLKLNLKIMIKKDLIQMLFDVLSIINNKEWYKVNLLHVSNQIRWINKF